MHADGNRYLVWRSAVSTAKFYHEQNWGILPARQKIHDNETKYVAHSTHTASNLLSIYKNKDKLSASK